MPVVIEELTAEITVETGDDVGGEIRPADSGAAAAATLELLALAHEREQRLAVD